MENTFLNQLQNNTNFDYTENGGLTRKTTKSKVLDLFAFGGAYRNRSDRDCVLLFKNAFEEDSLLAVKCLFYLRNPRGGQGERRFFRVCYKWLAENHPVTALKNLKLIPVLGRWDDLIVIVEGTSIEEFGFDIIKTQLYDDLYNPAKGFSLLGKWLPSINTSSKETRRLAYKLAKYLGKSPKEYRKMLSQLRANLEVVECLMSANKWNEIDFQNLPSRAGLLYSKAFLNRLEISERYKNFLKEKTSKVNAAVLYPHEIVNKILKDDRFVSDFSFEERLTYQKYWDNLKDFYQGREENAIAVVDVSGSMYPKAINAAVGLGAYIADKSKGAFANHFITFSGEPELVEFKGEDIVEKVLNCTSSNWGYHTDIEAVFDLLLATAKNKNVKKEDIPKKLYILSDMEFDYAFSNLNYDYDDLNSDLEKIKKKWDAEGCPMPSIIFWNLDARQNHIPALGEKISFVSGFSPSILEAILSEKTGYDLMLETLENDTYKNITV